MALTRIISEIIQDNTIDNSDISASFSTSISGSRDAASISGSLGANASTIRTLSSTTVSGSFGNQRVGTTDDVQFNHITASGNISASGIVIADTFQSTGGSVDGISFTDDLNITGNITASGDISGSGNIFGTGNLDIDGTSNLQGDVTLQSDLSVVDVNATNITGSEISSSTALFTTTTIDKIGGAINFNNENMTNVDIDSGNIDTVTFGSTVQSMISGSRDAASISGSRDATSISGSLGANAGVIRTLSAATVSGSFGNQRVGITDDVKFANITGSNNISASGNLSITGNVDIDGTSNFAGDVTMQNDLVVTGRLTAEEIHTTFISSSITQATGSNLFGDATSDSHHFTGSVDISGSLRVSDGNVVVSDTLTATNIGAFTAAGAIDFDNQNMTNVDIDSGTITGITDLVVADGGTGVSTLTDGGVLLGSGTSAITAMAVLTDGQMIVGDGTTDPVAESGATLRTSIGVGTTDDVKFANITGSNNISASGNISTTGTLRADGNVDFNADLDVNGTSNLDIVDIDGAVNMAADLTMGANILMADDTSIGIADDAERIEFDGAGDISVLGAQLLINQTASITIQGDNGLLQIASTDATAVQSLSKFSADANGFTLQFLKSRHATIGSNTIVQDDDTVGRIIFTAADGNDFGHASSEIRAQIDATPGTNEVPGRLVFLTTADGATGVTERMRIDSTGKVGIGTASPDYLVEIEKANGDHTSTALSITNTQAGGYGSSLNFVSERSDNNAHTIAARIRTQGNAAWNSDANTDSNLFFSTVVDNTLTDRMSISGTAGDVTVSTGNLIIGTSGKGIDFTAEAASGESGTDRTASVLDDYEEGTWTCTMTTTGTDFTTAGRGTSGTYTKIGKMVTVFADPSITTPSSGTGDFICTGLPFAPSDAKTFTSTSVHWGRVDLAGANNHYARCYGTGTNVLFAYSVNNANPSSILASHLNGNTTPYVGFTITYETAG